MVLLQELTSNQIRKFALDVWPGYHPLLVAVVGLVMTSQTMNQLIIFNH